MRRTALCFVVEFIRLVGLTVAVVSHLNAVLFTVAKYRSEQPLQSDSTCKPTSETANK